MFMFQIGYSLIKNGMEIEYLFYNDKLLLIVPEKEGIN